MLPGHHKLYYYSMVRIFFSSGIVDTLYNFNNHFRPLLYQFTHEFSLAYWLRILARETYPFITLWLECVATTLKSHVKRSSG
jgi:hypothetical protein